MNGHRLRENRPANPHDDRVQAGALRRWCVTPGSAAVLVCPQCKASVRMRELDHPGLFEDYRICPGCGGKFTPDSKTKYRQAVSIVAAIVSLVFTLLLYFDGTGWLIPASISYLVLGLMIYYGNKRIYLVPHGKDQGTADETAQTPADAGRHENNRPR